MVFVAQTHLLYFCYMKNLFATALVCLLFFASAFCPKAEEEQITIKGKTVATYIKNECLLGVCGKYEVSDMSGSPLFSVETKHYTDPAARNQGNPQGNVTYYDWTFYGSKTKVETDFIFRTKKFVDYLETNRLVDENGLNEQGVKNFALKYGTKHTDMQNRTILIR
jgi:hypothetical protein